MKRMRLANVTALFFLVTVSRVTASPFRVGDSVPRLRLPSIADGSPLSLADFRGEKLMLHVWASW